MELLVARDVCIERGDRPLLTDVNLRVCSGEIWQLLGANGVGKSSLMRALAGLARLGVEGVIERDASLIYLAHASSIKRHLSAEDNLRWHPSCAVVKDKGAIQQALVEVGLGGFDEQPVANLSAGQQRRVALARLLLVDARLWLLDEPFTALDSAGCQWLEEKISTHLDAGGSVVFTSHQTSRFVGRQHALDLGRHAVS